MELTKEERRIKATARRLGITEEQAKYVKVRIKDVIGDIKVNQTIYVDESEADYQYIRNLCSSLKSGPTYYRLSTHKVEGGYEITRTA